MANKINILLILIDVDTLCYWWIFFLEKNLLIFTESFLTFLLLHNIFIVEGIFKSERERK